MQTNPDTQGGAASMPEAYWMGGRLIIIRSAAPAGDAGPSITESWLRGGQGPEAIRHDHADTLTYVLSGNMTFQVDGQISTAGPGEAVSTPRGTVHTYRVDSEEGARILTISSPGYAWVDYIRAIGTPATELTLPPPSFQPLDMAVVRRLAVANGFSFVGPRLPGAGREGTHKG